METDGFMGCSAPPQGLGRTDPPFTPVYTPGHPSAWPASPGLPSHGQFCPQPVARHPAVSQLSAAASRFHPAENLLNPLAGSLNDPVAIVPGDASVDGRTLFPCHMERHPHFPAFLDEGPAVITADSPHRDLFPASHLCQHLQSGISLRRPARRGVSRTSTTKPSRLSLTRGRRNTGAPPCPCSSGPAGTPGP